MADEHILLPQHQAMIEESAISPEVAAERGYKSVTKKAELEGLGFPRSQRNVPALLLPVWGTTGEIVNYQVRPDSPRIGRNGKPVKYETPSGSGMVLDVPPRVRPTLGDPKVPLFITEGVKKADAGASVGLCILALLGVWTWRGTNEHGGKTALADWEDIALNGREVYIVFDSDVMTKRGVRLALERLKPFLEKRQATVRLIYLPSGPGAAKVGLDDFLAAGHDVDDLLARAADELREFEDGVKRTTAYFEKQGRTFWAKPMGSEGDTIDVLLANFTVRIVGDVIEDDGVESRRYYALEATLGEKTVGLEVQASRFASLFWVADSLGPSAIISAVYSARQHLPVAVQLLSTEIEERRVFAHTGWRRIEGEHVFLHAGGAIGEDGVVGGIRVRLEAPLDRVWLPAPPQGEERAQAVRESLALLTSGLAPDRVMFPLVAGVYLAPLGVADFTEHLFGKTGALKTTCAILLQRHFEGRAEEDAATASWSSTSNSLRETLFRAKDVMIVIDDFIPRGGRQEVRLCHAKADEVLRGVGNRAGRDRMRPDGSLRPPRPPRGLPLSTGEEIMAGHSLRARVVVLEIGKDDLDRAVLTERQEAAPHYSRAMSSFVQWLAPRLDRVREEMKAAVPEERDLLIPRLPHGRTATIGAQLLFSLEILLRFAEEVEAIDAATRSDLSSRGRVAIVETLAAQSKHHAHADPTTLFIEHLAGALQSGAAHLADRETGEAPQDLGEVAGEAARLCGWRLVSDKLTDEEGHVRRREEWRPGGALVGYIDVGAGDAFLLPTPAYQIAQRAAEGEPEGLSIGNKTLFRALDEAGLLASKDGGGDRRTKRIRCAGKPRSTLHLKLNVLFAEPGTPASSGSPRADGAEGDGLFPISVPDPRADAGKTGTKIGNRTSVVATRGGGVPEVPDVPDLEGGRTAASEREGALEMAAGTGGEPNREGLGALDSAGGKGGGPNSKEGRAAAEQKPPSYSSRIGNIGNEGDVVSATGAPACRCCRGIRWWRLRGGGSWTCGRCHPPSPPADRIEWREEGSIG